MPKACPRPSGWSGCLRAACANYTVKLTQVDGVDDELITWIKAAFDGAG